MSAPTLFLIIVNALALLANLVAWVIEGQTISLIAAATSAAAILLLARLGR